VCIKIKRFPVEYSTDYRVVIRCAQLHLCLDLDMRLAEGVQVKLHMCFKSTLK
jgi:hypothetical protein